MALFDDVWLTFVRDAMTKKGMRARRPRPDHRRAKNDTAKQVGKSRLPGQKMDAIVILRWDTAATSPMTKEVTAAKTRWCT